VLGLREVVHGAEPDGQRGLRGREDGSRDRRGLFAAGRALELVAGADVAMSATSAVRADKALRPTPSDDRCPALVYRSIEGLEIGL